MGKCLRMWSVSGESSWCGMQRRKRCPMPMKGEAVIEIRQLFDAEDFGENLTPELRAAEEKLRAETEKLK